MNQTKNNILLQLAFKFLVLLICTHINSVQLSTGLSPDSLTILCANSLVFTSYVASTKEDNNITSKDSIALFLNNFWKEFIITPSLPNDTKIAIQLRVRFDDKSQASYSQIFIVTVNDLDWLLERFYNIIEFKGDQYNPKNPIAIVFFHSIITDDLDNKYPLNYGKETDPTVETIKIQNFTVGKTTLPLTTDLTKWGKIKKHFRNQLVIKKNDSSFTYEVYSYINYNLVKVKDKTFSTVMEFKDFLGSSITSFSRLIGSTKYIIENSEIVFKEVNKRFQYMQPTPKHSKIFEKFITLDIETRILDGEFIPYCICLYDGDKAWSYYLTDFNSSSDMLKTAITSILRDKYNHYVVYAHNFSGFDGIFLLKVLTELGIIDP